MPMYTETHCEMCRQKFTDSNAAVEMYDPDDENGIGSLIVHIVCGTSRGWKKAE